MNTATAPSELTSATSLLVENVRIYLQVKNAFDQCDEEVQAVVKDMCEIVDDVEATEDEKQRAMHTIVEAIFPSLAFDFLINCDKARDSKQGRQKWSEMAEEEATFSQKLEAVMGQKRVTQEQLAQRIGVGQPAIANMLNRNCRPQRRTVVRMAEALGVKPQDLWPNIKAD